MSQTKQLSTHVVAFAVGVAVTISTCFVLNYNKMTVDLSVTEPTNDRVVAKAGGKSIYLQEVEARLRTIAKNVSFQDLNEQSKEVIIKDITAQKLILDQALKNKNQKNSSQAVKNFATIQIQKDFLNEKIEGKVTEESIKAQYDTLVESVKGKHEYRIKHILVKDEKDADKVSEYLKDNSFESAALKYSVDKKSATNGGDLGGYILEGSVNEAFDKKLAVMKDGQTSKPFQSDLGWHIIKLEDQRIATPDKYEIAKPKIKNLLETQEKQKYVQELIKDVTVEIL